MSAGMRIDEAQRDVRTAFAGGVVTAVYLPASFSAGAWFTAGTLLVFAFIGRSQGRSGVS